MRPRHSTTITGILTLLALGALSLLPEFLVVEPRVQAQGPDYEAACRLTPACMTLLANIGAIPAPASSPETTAGIDQTPTVSAYTDSQIAAAIDVGWNEDLDRIMHTCTANIGGFWNTLSEVLSTDTGQPLRAFEIHGQPPLSRVAQEADFARRAYADKPATDDVRDLVGNDVFTIWAEPEAEGDMRTAANLQATGIETIIVRPRGDSEGERTVQPLSLETMDGTSTDNLWGASIELFGAVATFDSDAIQNIIADADLEALVITRTGEFKCNLDDTRLIRGFNPDEYR